jgi:hypothetical protein
MRPSGPLPGRGRTVDQANTDQANTDQANTDQANRGRAIARPSGFDATDMK